MSSNSRWTRRLLRVPVVLAMLGPPATIVAWAPAASAQDPSAAKEANVHFQRAVALYTEADYRAALVEFKRAYEIAPHVAVLYNIGQAYFQTQSYAHALATFERFLAEGGTPNHKAEVEAAVATLKGRVGKLAITTTSPAWEIAIDDEVVGTTPLASPVVASIGRRKVTATKANEPPVTRFVEVAAGETAQVALTVGAAAPAAAPAAAKVVADRPPAPPPERGTSGLLIAGWVGTGALAAGGVVTAILASSAADKLDKAREAFPGDKSDIDSKASKTTALSITTDALFAGAIILGGVSLYFTLRSSPSSSAKTSPPPSQLRVGGGPGSVMLSGTF